MQERVDDYLEMGVGCVWLVDPRRRKGFIADSAGTRSVLEFVVPGTQISVKTSEVFAELDQLEARHQ
ncbi:hypothetical protein BH10ACI4_BH10ACI4_22740 [soil metagenome]